MPQNTFLSNLDNSNAIKEIHTSRWQDKYADPDWKTKLTKLDLDQEGKFQNWANTNKVPITPDYDMRGFWRDGGQSGISPVDGRIHYTDKYKTPLHESFSGESIYSKQGIPKPTWNKQNQLIDPSGKVLFDEPAIVKQRRGY